MTTKIMDEWKARFWETRSYEGPSSLWFRRGRAFAAIAILVIGTLLAIANTNLLFFFVAIWLAIFATYPTHGFLIFYCVITIFPISRAVTVSLRPAQNLLSTSLAVIPDGATFDSFRRLFTEQDFALWVWNSLVITVTVSLLGVVIASTSAYAFSRWKFPGRSFGLILLLSTQMIPAGMLLIPIFIIVSKLDLTNNVLGLALAYTTTTIPLSIWILRGYYDTIPFDLEEAAMVDGATRMAAFFRVILPLSTPALAVIFLFNFLAAWNEYMVANVILKADALQTWPLGLNTLIGQFQTQWGTYAAGSVIITIPVVILFLYSSRWLVGGLTVGSVKG
jgi:arabinogalactan oligomer/maltooligosaccharide transport system permease protein